MAVTADHTGAHLGATFPSALHSMAHQAVLGVFSCFCAIAINGLCGPNKMQCLGEPEEDVCTENKESSQTLHAPASSSSFFQGDGFSHFMCLVLFI